MEINKNKKCRAARAVAKRFFAAVLAVVLTMPICMQTRAVAAEARRLIPIGDAVGINIKTKGLIVAAVGEICTEGGAVSPAEDAGIAPGDILTGINGENIDTAEELSAALESVSDNITVTVVRDGKERELTVSPHIDDGGEGKLGLWLRDGLCGIGTVTFYDPETGTYGALGHSVSDADTGVTVPVGGGELMKAEIFEVVKGAPGAPGRLNGRILPENILGDVLKNTEGGIFGTAEKYILSGECESLPVAENSEIHTGEAFIMSNVNGEDIEKYSVKISRIYSGFENDNRNMMITVTDRRLLDTTGGIVQGMSGSPVIQDGKIIGAVTHVLINNPEKGYAISMENMLRQSEYSDAA